MVLRKSLNCHTGRKHFDGSKKVLCLPQWKETTAYAPVKSVTFQSVTCYTVRKPLDCLKKVTCYTGRKHFDRRKSLLTSTPLSTRQEGNILMAVKNHLRATQEGNIWMTVRKSITYYTRGKHFDGPQKIAYVMHRKKTFGLP